MAEDNAGFSPLDPLGPEYGSINPVRPDIKSVTPFEGERLRDAPINFPEPKYYPIMPGVDLDNPSQAIRKNVVGSPGNPPSKKGTFEELKKANVAFLKSRVATSADPNQYGKIYSYDAGPSGNAFYKRYMAYGAEKFDEIGFSPLRDNEALFNSRTTRMDDFKRMMTHSFIPLFSNGFTSGPKSFMKMLSGDFTSSDLQDAQAYEEAAAIGQSSKGGVFGFTNNLMMNFAYTAGIISEAVLEEVGGVILAPVTGGASLFAATANNARKVGKIGSALGAAVDGMKAVRSTISNLGDLRYARNFKNTVEKLSTTTLGRIANPLENTLEAISGIRKIKATDNISSLAQISKTAGGLYRDARNINMALSEARLEAGMVENKVYDELYNQFYEANDRAPSNAEQSAMIKQSKDAATNTLFWNAGIIYASNKITFDNITGPRGGLRNFVKSTTDDVMSVGGGKFGNLGKIVYDKVDEVFTFEGNNIKELAKSWWKNPGFKTAAKTVGYLKANFTEGLQENLQEVIAGANEKYYIETFNSRGRRASEYSKGLAGYAEKSQGDYFAEELGAQISTQGLETFASGFLMGTLASPLNNAVPFFTHGYNRMFNKDEFQKYKDMKTEVTTGIVEKLNNIDINSFLKSKEFSYGTQDILASIKKNGTKKEAMDAEMESLIKATGTMVRTNTVDVFTDKLKTYTEMTDEELVDAIKGITIDEAPKYRQRVFNSIERIERIKDRYDYYTDKMPNPINPEELESMDKSSKEYMDRVTLYHAWNLAVENAVFFNEAFEDTSKRMVDIQQNFLNNTTLKKTGQREMNLLFRPDTIIEEVDILENELKALEGMETKSPAVQKQIQQKKKAIDSYKEFYAKQQMFNLFFNRGDYYDIIKARLKKELKREPTEAELDEAFNSEIGKIDDQTKAEEVTSDLRVAFYDYMKNVAAANEDTVFDDNLEKGFAALLDHYKLGQESRSMVEYINTLHNPKSFFEVANRNSAWMQQLYKNRVKYYEAMVKAEINSVEDNALLNALADKGIFVSLEDFAKWQEDRTAPTEFFDNVNKKVYTQGTDEYATYYELFRQAEELKDETTDVTTTVLQKELQDNLEALQVQREQEIESLPATEVETERVPIQRPEGSKTMGLKNVFEDMQDGDYVEVTRKQKKQLVKEIYYRDGDTLVVGDKGGEVVDLEKSKFRVVKASKYRVEMQADPAQVEAINTEYDQLEEQLKAESPVQLPTDSEGNIAERITDETLLSEYPMEIYNQLSDIYGQMQVDNGVDITSIPIDQYEQEFFNWVKTSPQAKEVIDAYNNSLSPAPVEVAPTSPELQKEIDKINERREKELEDNKDRLDDLWMIGSTDTIGERINAKYNEEIDALKKATPTATPISDIEAKKADIERRRQEELKNNIYPATKIGSNRDKYGRGQDIYEINGENYFVDYKKGEKIPTIYKENPDKINAKYDAEIAALEGQVEEPITDWADIISKATERELDAIIDQIDKADQMTPELLDLITNKRQEYAIKNSKKGDLLIAKKDVFYKNKSGENAIFTSAFSTAVITKVDEKTGKISIKPLGADTEITLSINEINAKFNLKETVDTPEIVVASMKITDEDKSNIAESSDNVDSFANNASKHEEIHGRVESKDVTIEDLDDDVLNDLEC